MRRIRNDSDRVQPPARTPEGRERQLVSLAVDLAEKQLREGTAKSSVIVHFLKLGSSMADLERQELIYQTEMLKAKAEAIKSQKDIAELYTKAIDAMGSYRPSKGEELENDY